MICVVVLFRNAPRLAENCLQSLRASVPGDAAFLLVDDCSNPELGILDRLKAFRESTSAEVRILRFRRQMHYNHGLAYGLSLSAGADVLFVSHDMQLAPDCVAAIQEAASEGVGIVRPTSQHMDWAKKFVMAPPQPPATLDDVVNFSSDIRRRFGNEAIEWPMLIGDAMLIRREVIEKVGVFDPRFYGFIGDIDYGIRARRAGFRHVIARGAWLHHEGAGTAKESAEANAKGQEMLRLVEAAYEKFRQKWGDAHLPPHFRDMRREHFDALHAQPPGPGDAFIAPLLVSDEVGEWI